MAYFLRNLGTTTVLGILLLSAFIFIGIIYYSRPRNKIVIKKAENADIIKSHKILKLAGEAVEAD
jgi:hypothetical protein